MQISLAKKLASHISRRASNCETASRLLSWRMLSMRKDTKRGGDFVHVPYLQLQAISAAPRMSTTPDLSKVSSTSDTIT